MPLHHMLTNAVGKSQPGVRGIGETYWESILGRVAMEGFLEEASANVLWLDCGRSPGCLQPRGGSEAAPLRRARQATVMSLAGAGVSASFKGEAGPAQR